MDEYGPLIEALMSFEPPVHVFGGFAEDALLYGTSVRTHHDVDVLVGRDELEAQLRNAQAIAFSSREVHYERIAAAVEGDVDRVSERSHRRVAPPCFLNVTVTVETMVAALESRLGRGGGVALTPAPG